MWPEFCEPGLLTERARSSARRQVGSVLLLGCKTEPWDDGKERSPGCSFITDARMLPPLMATGPGKV